MEEKTTFHFGWIIVGISFTTLALAYGVWYSFSFFFVALLKEFGWSRSMAAGAFSIFVILHSLIGPFVGGMVDRFGPRKVIVLGSSLLGVGLVLCSFIRTWWQFYIFFGVITAMGVGSIGWVPNATVIQYWFKEKRGLPIGIISSGIGIGILVCSPSFQYLITRVGWRMTYRIIAISIPLIIISLAIAFLKKSPETASNRHVKKEIPPVVIQDSLLKGGGWGSRSWTVRQAVRKKAFWHLGLAFFLGSVTTHSVFTHQVAFFVDRGLQALFASYLVAMIGAASIGGKILCGVLSDRIGREVTYTIGTTFSILSMITLTFFHFFPFPGLTYFYSVFFGLGYAAIAALPPLITADLFAGHAYGGIFGLLMIFVGAGGALGAWVPGLIYDRTGSYIAVFILMIVFALFACLMIWKATPRKIKTVVGPRGIVSDGGGDERDDSIHPDRLSIDHLNFEK